MNLPKRKLNRLSNYDYSQPGSYFITVCTKDRKEILSVIEEPSVGNAVLGIPLVRLSKYGMITEKIILQMQNFYSGVNIDKYVIMPNHIHLIVTITDDGVPGTAHPTVSGFIGTLKRFVNKEAGKNIWQSSFYDHIIRDENDYQIRWEYIKDNPAKWFDDELYKNKI